MQTTSIRLGNVQMNGRTLRGTEAELVDLVESMDDIGQMQEIVVDSKYRLIAGRRRMEAAKRLNWTHIRAAIIPTFDEAVKAIRGERDENTCRVKPTPKEIGELAERLTEMEKPKAEARQRATRFGQNGSANLGATDGIPGETREKVAESLEISAETLRKIEAIREAAKADPERYGELQEALAEPRSVDRAYKELRKRQAKARTKAESLKDALGVEVPSGLRDLFGDPFLGNLARSLEEIYRDALPSLRKAADKKGPAYKWLILSKVLQSLDNAKDELEQAHSLLLEAAPHAVCPKCEGKSCGKCRESGWFPKWRYTELKKGGQL